MKKVDGVTASKEILSFYPDAKIIIITTYNNSYIKKEVLAAGVYKYILKENLSGLLEMLEEKNSINDSIKV